MLPFDGDRNVPDDRRHRDALRSGGPNEGVVDVDINDRNGGVHEPNRIITKWARDEVRSLALRDRSRAERNDPAAPCGQYAEKTQGPTTG